MRGGGKVGTGAVSFAPLSSVCHVDCPTRQPLDPFPLRTLELLFSVSLRRRLGGGKGGAGAVSFSPPSPVSDYCVVLPHALPASSPRVFYRAQAEAKSSGAREHLRSPGGPRRALSPCANYGVDVGGPSCPRFPRLAPPPRLRPAAALPPFRPSSSPPPAPPPLRVL